MRNVSSFGSEGPVLGGVSDESGARLAQLTSLLQRQNELLRELKSAYVQQTKLASALCQAAQLAEAGAIDVSDILATAKHLITSGAVKMSAAEEAFREDPGLLDDSSANRPQTKLDPLTAFLRRSWGGSE